MKIYTGYYGNLKAYAGMTLVGISVGVPKWISFEIPNCRCLNPKPYMLKLEKEPYTAAYERILAELDPKQVVDYLTRLSNGRDVVLLCYEKPQDFCHRQIVADWLNRTLNLGVCEYVKPKPENLQMELF